MGVGGNRATLSLCLGQQSSTFFLIVSYVIPELTCTLPGLPSYLCLPLKVRIAPWWVRGVAPPLASHRSALLACMHHSLHQQVKFWTLNLVEREFWCQLVLLPLGFTFRPDMGTRSVVCWAGQLRKDGGVVIPWKQSLPAAGCRGTGPVRTGVAHAHRSLLWPPCVLRFFVCFLLFSFFFFAMVSFISIISIYNRKEGRALGSGGVLGVVADLEI